MEPGNLTELIQCHLATELFDYDIVVDWSIHLMANGIESENILILASFSKPVDPFEIRPYVTATLADLYLPEFTGIMAKLHKARYHVREIIDGHSVRHQLKQLADLCVNTEYNYGLKTFYLLYFGWIELDEIGVNFYYKEATRTNIDQILNREACIWVEKFEELEKNLPSASNAHKHDYSQ